MKWIKKGLIIKPSGKLFWMVSHAMLPIAEQIDNDLFRIYFSGRDKYNRSYIGYVHINLNNPCEILYITKKPVLGLGELGCFDDNGVTPSWIVNYKDKKYLFYIGWNKGSTVRMHLIAGLAISEDDGKSFKRYSKAPILERSNDEPLSILTSPCVFIENDIWRMWYVSGVKWIDKNLPRYNIKYAESKDGLKWDRKQIICIDFKNDSENALARPCVIKNNNLYKMWFSYKGKNYRIGYAESKDGINWIRKDKESGIDVSKKGWDSVMIEYAYVFENKGKKYMLYNGNEYGKYGIGLAVERKT